MKRKKTSPRTRQTPGPPRPFRLSKPIPVTGNSLRTLSRILIAVIVLYAAVRFFTTSETTSIPLDASNYQSWYLKDVRHFEPGLDFSSIECDQPCYVISPTQSRLGIDPAHAPYVRVVFAAGTSLRDPRILLSSPAQTGAFLSRRGLLRSDHLICDLRDSQPYASIAPYTATINRVGVSFTGKLLLSRIEVSGAASLADRALLARDAFNNQEPSAPHAINELSGVYVLGHGHTAWALIFLLLTTLLILSFARTRYLCKFSIALGCTLLFLYLPWAAYFLSQVSLSGHQSSFKYGMYDEYASRYGEDFASLSRVLNDSLKPGSRVHFIRRPIDACPTEENLAAFIHSIRYVPCEFGDADYYFGCRCPGIYDQSRGQLTEPHTGKTAKVAPVYRQGDSFLLRTVK